MTNKSFLLLLFSLSLLFSCKKEFLRQEQTEEEILEQGQTEQEVLLQKQIGAYMGNLHYQASYTTWDFAYDSIAIEVNLNGKNLHQS